MSRSYLQKVYHHKVSDAIEVNLICLPDLPFKDGNIPWNSVDWATFLPKVIPLDTEAYIYHYEVTLSDPFNWGNLMNQCDKLFGELVRVSNGRHEKPKPIFFICERLGGIIFKETMLKIQARSHLQHDLINQISCVVFLATPHCIDDDQNARAKFSDILRRAYRDVKDSVFSGRDLALLSLISERFEECPFQLPLCSVYETQPTKLHSSRFALRKSTVILVDFKYARINIPSETMVASDIAIGDLARLPSISAKLHGEISTFFGGIARTAAQKVSNFHDPQSMGNDALLSNSCSTQEPQPVSGLSTSRKPCTVWRESFNASPSDSERSPSRSSDGSYDIVTKISTLKITVKVEVLPFRQISPHTVNEDFFPRETIIQDMERYLIPDERGRNGSLLKSFVLYGPAGHGKTELAASFFFTHKNDFDVMIFLNADDKNKLEREIAHCVTSLGIVDEHEAISNPKHCQESLLSWLEYPLKGLSRDRRPASRRPLTSETEELANVLVVLDNADEPDLVWETCWPRDGRCSVLVTSQDPSAMSKQYFGCNGMEVGPLSHKESIDMLKQLCVNPMLDTPQDSRDVATIASQLDGFPLAIVSASSMIGSDHFSFEDLKELLYEDGGYQEFLMQRIGGKVQRGYRHKSVAAAISLDTLESDLGPRALLGVLSFLDPDSVKETILQAKADVQILQDACYPVTKFAYGKARTALLHRSMIKRNRNKKELWLHRFLRNMTIALLKNTPDDMRNLFTVAVTLIRSQWPSSIGAAVGKWSEVSRWEACSSLYIHICAMLSVFKANEDILSPIPQIRSFVELLADAGRYQFEVANASEAHRMIGAALAVLEPKGSEFLFLKSYAYGVRALLYLEHPDGRDGYHHAGIWVGIEKELFEHDKRYTGQYAAAHNAMGVACAKLGLFTKAKRYLKISQTVREELPGFKPSNNFSPFREFARVAMAEGKFKEAEELLLLTLRHREEELGVGDKVSERTGTLYYALGNVYQALGSHGDSFQYHLRALEQFKATAGLLHPTTAMALYKMTGHYMASGQIGYNTAQDHIKQAVRIYKNRDYKRPELARCLFRQASIHKTLNNHSEAQKCLDAAADIFSEMVPGPPVVPQDLRESDFDGIVPYDVR